MRKLSTQYQMQPDNKHQQMLPPLFKRKVGMQKKNMCRDLDIKGLLKAKRLGKWQCS